ncbi:hypothetical protein BGZ58_004014, partial [Dissophora ornata]
RPSSSIHKPWKLKTGTVVDEVLINYARTCKAKVAAHSFIFGTFNEYIMKEFSEKERMEILAHKATPVSNGPALVSYLMSLNKTTTAELRERLQTNDVHNLNSTTGRVRANHLLDIKMISELLVVMSQVMLFHEQMRINISKLDPYSTTDLLQKLTGPCITPSQKHRPLPTARSPSANSEV